MVNAEGRVHPLAVMAERGSNPVGSIVLLRMSGSYRFRREEVVLDCMSRV